MYEKCEYLRNVMFKRNKFLKKEDRIYLDPLDP